MGKIDKTEKQDEISDLLVANMGGIVYGATGIGKSRIAVRTVEKIRELFPDYKCVWAVPTQTLRDEDSPAEVKKWKTTERFQCDFVCYKSLLDYSGGDILVLDEFHHITFNNMEGYLKKPPKVIIAVTATGPTNDDKKDIIKKLNLKVIANIPLKKALEHNFVQDFELHVCKINLDESVRYVKGFKYQKEFITEAQRSIDLNKLIGRIKDEQGRAPFHLLLARKRFLGDLRSKNAYAKKIIKKWENKRILIFCTSIKQAEELCPYNYHSKTDSMHLEWFNAKKINHLSAVQALDEGVNLTDVENVLIIGTDAEIRRLIQKIGRAIRLRATTESCKVCVLISKDTQEEVWLSKNIKEFDLPDNKIFIYEPKIN